MLNIPSRMEGPEQKTIIGKTEITVSAKGIANGKSVYLNDGADFGPDTKLGATIPGQYGPSYTTTDGLAEAFDYADAIGGNVSAIPNTFSISSSLTFMQHSNAIFHANGATIKALSAMSSMLIVNNGNQQFIENLIVDGNNLATNGFNIINGSFGLTIDGAGGKNTTGRWLNINMTGNYGGIRLLNCNDDSYVLPGGSLSCNLVDGNILRISNCSFNGSSSITAPFIFANNSLVKGLSANASSARLSKCYIYADQSHTDFNGNSYCADLTGNFSFAGCVFDCDGSITGKNVDIIAIVSGGSSIGANYYTFDNCQFFVDPSGSNTAGVYLTAVYANGNPSIISGRSNLVSASSPYTGNAYLQAAILSYAVTNIDFAAIDISSGTFTMNTTNPSLSANPPASGSVYQNKTGTAYKIYLPVYATTTGTAGYVTIARGATSTPATIGNRYVNGATTSTSLDIIELDIPAGHYYSFTASGVTFGTASVFAE